MIGRELENRRKVEASNVNVKRIYEIETWFKYEYPKRLNRINRYSYLGLPCEETRYSLELEAYDKENELRSLKGESKLPPLKLKKLI